MSGLWNKILDWLTPSDQTQWDMAASSLELSGYTDFDIVNQLGPRPKDEPKDSDA
jgi:hypothetical protein